MNLKEEGIKKLEEQINSTRLVVEKQINLFTKQLMRKLSEDCKSVSLDRLSGFILKNFTIPIKQKIDEEFNIFLTKELEFYTNYLTTVDLIFENTKVESKKNIYLNNILKKIELRKIEEIDFSKLQEYISELFQYLVHKIILTSHLSIEDSKLVREVATKSYNTLTNDMVNSLDKLAVKNKIMIITQIEDKMDKEKIDGKTIEAFRTQRKITEQTIRLMEKLLDSSILKIKESAKKDLEFCSSSVVDVIFRLLPKQYQTQKELLDVIIDTVINERLSNILDYELNKLKNNLNEINTDIIGNELYTEKRYKNIDSYTCDFEVLNRIYEDVLYEIKLAYDIPDDMITKRINMIIYSETSAIRDIFKKVIDNINKENEYNMNRLKEEMHKINNSYVEQIKIKKLEDNN